ncbi:DNA polymerase Y family protein [Leifsonia sp. Root112D2]|uniref:DNA polymerase Y family protein n=1 Tax=Leifsonia sp. Root112D2 TaxID=1736426 RepID=UPI0019111783|nr:DNA polymerase Y family protein [Leifsonia sp. Root112D2]
MSTSRAIVVWVPDWPVAAVATAPAASGLSGAGGAGSNGLVAVIENGRVFACSAAARAEGVRRGHRLREAQARCPQLTTIAYDPVLDARSYEPVLALIERLMPGVQPIRPGMCAIRARGPARFYGGEHQAASVLLGELAELGFDSCRVGIADGLFAAEQAARSGTGIHIVPPGESPRFLAPLPVGILGDATLATLLIRLGMGTLGDFAALDAFQVRHRFGELGARAHALAGGVLGGSVVPRVPQKELDVAVEFEPPLSSLDQVAFAFRTAAERFITQLSDASQVCTAVRVSVTSESGEVSEREWLHPRWFTAADVVDRVRWQLQGSGSGSSGLSSAVTRVSVSPGGVDAAGNHEEGLWGTAPDERIHHALSRVQGLLGHDAVLTPVMGGGRMLADRQLLVSWGDRAPTDAAASQARPWPGRLPPPLPSSVFAPPRPAVVVDPAGDAVLVDERGRLTGPPARMSVQGRDAALRSVSAWSGPWSVDERWWDAGSARHVNRFQVVDDSGCAWLLLQEGERWLAEARYD